MARDHRTRGLHQHVARRRLVDVVRLPLVAVSELLLVQRQPGVRREQLLVRQDLRGRDAVGDGRLPYNDIDWVAGERVLAFRIEYSQDDATWTQVFQSSSPDDYLVGNVVTATWTGVSAKYWRWVLESHNCATVQFIEWKGASTA